MYHLAGQQHRRRSRVDRASTPILSWCVCMYMYICIYMFQNSVDHASTPILSWCVYICIYIYVYTCSYIQQHQRRSRVDHAATPILSGCIYICISMFICSAASAPQSSGSRFYANLVWVCIHVYLYLCICSCIQKHRRCSRVGHASAPILSLCAYRYTYTYIYMYVYICWYLHDDVNTHLYTYINHASTPIVS